MRQLVILLIFAMVFSCSEHRRIQEPNEIFPYEVEEVNISTADKLTLSGTLTSPLKDTLKTAVILIGGSGPSDRDYKNRFGHRPFLVLSHHLTQQGISVLRFDERGVGKSEGNYKKATIDEFVADVVRYINYLRNERKFVKVGLIGHSQGAQIASLASLQANTDFLVLMAPGIVDSGNTLVYQTGTRLKRMNVDENTSQKIVRNVDSLIHILKTAPNPVLAKEKMEAFLLQKENEEDQDYIEASRRLGDPYKFIEGLLDPKFIYCLHNNGLESLKKINIPVLILYGDNDKTVDVKSNLMLIDKFLDSTKYEVKLFEGLEHLFMKTNGIPLEQYHTIEETISPEVLNSIDCWILIQL